MNQGIEMNQTAKHNGHVWAWLDYQDYQRELGQRHQRLMVWRNQMLALSRKADCEMFMNFPERWYIHTTWGCANGHASKMYLKSEEHGPLCLECLEPIVLVPPEATDTILANVIIG